MSLTSSVIHPHSSPSLSPLHPSTLTPAHALHLLLLPITASTGPKKVQLVTSEVGHGVFISGVMTKVNGQLALVMDIGNQSFTSYQSIHHDSFAYMSSPLLFSILDEYLVD